MKCLSLLSLISFVFFIITSCNQNSTFDRAKLEVHSEPADEPLMPKKQQPPISYGDYVEDPSFHTEEYEKITENEFKDATKNPLSTFSIDVDNASYSNTRRFIMNGQMPPKDAVRIEEFINYFDYKYPTETAAHPFSVITEVSECPWNPEHRLVHVGLQGKEVAKEKMPASNLVFLIDVSGSMDQPNKLPLLRNSFKMLVNELRPEDRVAIVVYAGASGVVLNSTPGTEKRLIRNAIHELRPGGSTAGAAGIKMAYKIAKQNLIKEGNNRVILATDGDFNVGVSSNAELVRLIENKREEGIFLSILGFGTGNYKDAKMEQIADNGNGNYAYIDNINEAKKVLVDEMTSTLYAVAKDVKLQLEFNPAHVKEYRLVGYENRLLNDEDFNDDKKDAGEIGAGHTVTALYEIIPADSDKSMSANIDDLKYQEERNLKSSAKNDPDLVTIKLRYKEPKSEASKKFELTARDTGTKLEETSDAYRFSASVASFGMLLRDSKFKGISNYAFVEEMARGALGDDVHGYRNEFVRLVELVQAYNTDETAEK